MKIKRILLSILLLSLMLPGTPVTAHEHWMDLSDFQIDKNTEVAITIASGHRFPESKMALNDIIINQCMVVTKGKTAAPFTTKVEKTKRTGNFTFNANGVYLVETNLKRPQIKEPLYYARAIILVGNQKTPRNQDYYKTGIGLEIVPLDDLQKVEAGMTLRLMVFFNGNPVKNTCTVSTAGGRQFFLTPHEDGSLEMKIGKN